MQVLTNAYKEGGEGGFLIISVAETLCYIL